MHPEAGPETDAIRTAVQAHLTRFLDTQEELLGRISQDLVPFVGVARTLLAGGKRLRPMFCYWGWRGAGADTDDRLLHAAAALELLQAAALVHDDVMDDSDTRRGRPSVHRQFSARHLDAGWLGSPSTFGTGAAILLGDLCLTWADELVFTSGLPADALLRAKPFFDLMRTEVTAGQYLDLLEQARGGGSVDRALLVVRTKTASYTVERPLQLGGALAGARPELMTAYRAYGLSLGEAFQLRDDLLGVYGDPAETGKPAGDDLREGKRTVLVAIAAQRADRDQAAELDRLLGDRSLPPDVVDSLRRIIDATGAVDEVESMIGVRTDAALAALVDVPEPARAALEALAKVATTRRH